MKNIQKIFLFVILTVILVGMSYASDVSNDTTSPEIMEESSNHAEHEITKEYKANKKDENTKTQTKTIVTRNNGTIGETLELNAKVSDSNNKKVNEGYVLFKLNGLTLKDNKKLTGSNNPLKVNVINGLATVNVTADLSMRYAQNLTAVYSGTNTYDSSRSNTAKVQIRQRNASLIVTSNTQKIKQGQTLTIKAQIYDTTNGKKSTKLIPYEDEYVYFKVNGLTFKDSNGDVLKTKVVNGVATTNYTIPLGLSGVTDAQTMTPKNHTILSGFYNKNYQENIRNTSTFQVERSPITIRIDSVTINNKEHKLSLDASIRDYLGNYVSGPNKCIVKINGVSLKNGTKPLYYYSTNGRLNIKNTPVPLQDKYTSLEVVTQDRLAYKSARNTTTKFNIIKQDTIINIDAIAKTDYNKIVTITGRITGKANENLNNKTLTVNLNGITKRINTDNRGYFTYTNQTNKVGSNTVTVLFNGDDNYLSTSNKATFEVIHKPTIIDYEVNDVNYSDYSEIWGVLTDKDHNELKLTRVILKINGETYYTRTDDNGQFQYYYQPKNAGKNIITITFNGTEYYNSVSKSKTFNVFKKENNVYIDSLPEIISLGDNMIISGGVIDNQNNIVRNVNVTIKVNNQRFNLKTDDYGYYILNYKPNKVGTNTVDVSVIGNENYQISTASKNFTVMQTYNLTLNFYKNQSDEKIVYYDRFGSFYQSTDGQWPQGVYVFVENIYEGIDGQADNLLLNATFYFKNANGNIIAESFTDFSEEWLSHELISGYTPLKVTVTYRKKTGDEKSLWYDGYRYNPIAKEWIQEYNPYENSGET